VSEEQTAAAVAAAAKSVRRMFGLTLAAVVVAILVLAIDHGIKRDVLKAAGDARKTLDEFNARVMEAVIRGETGPAEASAGHPADAGDYLDDASRASKAADGHEANGRPSAARRTRRPAGGSRGDG
jgi:hypothetical protein